MKIARLLVATAAACAFAGAAQAQRHAEEARDRDEPAQESRHESQQSSDDRSEPAPAPSPPPSHDEPSSAPSEPATDEPSSAPSEPATIERSDSVSAPTETRAERPDRSDDGSRLRNSGQSDPTRTRGGDASPERRPHDAAPSASDQSNDASGHRDRDRHHGSDDGGRHKHRDHDGHGRHDGHHGRDDDRDHKRRHHHHRWSPFFDLSSDTYIPGQDDPEGAAPASKFGVVGVRLPPALYAPRYRLVEPARYGLRAPPEGAAWVRCYADVLLVDLRTGVVLDVILDFFAERPPPPQ